MSGMQRVLSSVVHASSEPVLATSHNPTSEGGRARVSREVRGEVVRADELSELPCGLCRVLTAEIFLSYVDVSTSLPFAGEVCERCAAELAAEQERAR